MTKKHMLDCTVSANEPLNEAYFMLRLTYNQALPSMLPGQFAEVRVDGSPSTYLRRPISICDVDREKNELSLLIQKIGDGTHQLAELKVNDILNLIIPLGKSYTLPNSDSKASVLLIGGGVGIAPLLFLGRTLKALGIEPQFLLGFRSKKEMLSVENYQQYGKVYITTEDGSIGEKGFVTQHSILNSKIDQIYTCGPTPMMKAVAKYAIENEVECEVSLENTMACGIGACLCCVTDTKKGHQCVCTEGPVFNIKELKW